MKPSTAFIPCAGMGSRMGEVGKSFPKPLWPIFEKSSLEIIMFFLKKEGIQNFYINTHHLHSELSEYIERNNLEIEILFEPELLGSGGGIHNLKNNNKSLEEVIIHNSDIQLSHYDDLFLEKGDTLYCLNVPGNSPYNSLIVENHRLTGIENSKKEAFLSFSGMSKVNLLVLKEASGYSEFFKTVFPLEQKPKCFEMGPREYWDFGTLDLYHQNIWKLFLKDSKLKERYLEYGFIDSEKIDLHNQSYDCEQKGVLNFSKKPLEGRYEMGTIVLDEKRNFLVKSQNSH